MINHNSGIINARTPIRIDFGGGPTDVWPFPLTEKGVIVNAAIRLYAYVRLKRRKDKLIIIKSYDYNNVEKFSLQNKIIIKDPLRLIKACVYYLGINHGLEIETKVDVPSGSGLGSSAALTISLLGAMYADLGKQVPDGLKLAKDAIFVENELLHNINGGQDQYASALGGFHSFVFENKNIKDDAINIPIHTLLELEERSLLCYSGDTHLSGEILKKVMNKYIANNFNTKKALFSIRDATIMMKNALEKSNLQQFATLLNHIYMNQKKLHPDIATFEINKIIVLAKKYGAIGGKIAGAGGGGFVYLFCQPFLKQNVAKVLSKEGFITYPISFSEKGIIIWFS